MHRCPSVNGNLFQVLFEAHRQLPLQKAAFAVAGLLLQWLLSLRQLTLVCGSLLAWYYYNKEHSAKAGKRLRHVARALPRTPALLPPRVLPPERLTVGRCVSRLPKQGGGKLNVLLRCTPLAALKFTQLLCTSGSAALHMPVWLCR